MPVRIGGLASGMDIDGIVSDLMKAERTRTDKVTQDKTLLEWTRKAYTDVNKLFAEFILKTRESFGLTDSSSGFLANQSVRSLKWIRRATVGDAGIADVSARAGAANGAYGLTVTQLAANWSAASSDGISAAGQSRSNLASQFGLTDEDVVHFSISTGTGTKEQRVQITIENGMASVTKTSYGTGEDGEDSVISLLSGKDISDLSLKELASQINRADIGVTASYEESIDRFFLQTNQTGAENTVSFSDESVLHDETGQPILDEDGNAASFLGKLKLRYDIMGTDAAGQPVQTPVDVLPGTCAGRDAVFDFGAARGITRPSNQFTINDIDFDLKAVGRTTVQVDTDEDAVMEKITEFQSSYNELIDKIDSLLREEEYRDYPPLTAEQKSEMTEKEIELWEGKAKSGLLRNDSLIGQVMQKARLGLYERVKGLDGSFDQLTEIGITTERYAAGTMGGRLEIDEGKLREAIRKDPEGIVDLLFHQPDPGISDETEKRQDTGLVGRMYGDMISGMKEIILRAGPGEDAKLYRSVNSTMLLDFVTKHGSISMLDESISDYEEKVYRMGLRLADKEESYWKKFTAMETALNKMYSQSNWLTQQLGMKSGN